jgi:hypothetical protein
MSYVHSRPTVRPRAVVRPDPRLRFATRGPKPGRPPGKPRAGGRRLAQAKLALVPTDRRANDEPFVAFGPEQARKGREAAGLPEPPDVADTPTDAGLIRRVWALLTRGSDEARKLWASKTSSR